MNRSGNTLGSLRARIVLPFVLPTHNRILSMSMRQRMSVKKFIRDTVSTCIRDAGGSRTPTGYILRAQLTAWSLAVYLATIRPTGSSLSKLLRQNVREARRSRR